MTKQGLIFKELPIELVERDMHQPRKEFGTGKDGSDGDENRLRNSIKQYGIEEPIKVSEISENRYIIIDGHRRYICAQALGMKQVPCRIYSKMSEGEFETRRYEIQNNRRPWKPLERSEALERIKGCLGFHTNHELADYLNLSKTAVQMALQLRKQKLDYLGLMEKHDLPETYRYEFVIMMAKIRKIRDLEVDDIIKIIFKKIEHKVIYRGIDLRKIGKIFLRATINEKEIYDFLQDVDMTVSELEQRTLQSGFALLIDQLIQKIAQKREEGIAFSQNEKTYLAQLATLLKKAV